MVKRREGLLIAGGGLAGCLAALAMAKRRPDVPLLLVEEGERFGGGRSWPFFEADVAAEDRWLVEPLIAHSWPGYYVAFTGQSRKLKAPMHLITADQLDRAMRETLREDQYRLGTRIVAVRDDELVLPGGEKIKAQAAVDARGAANLSMLRIGWRVAAVCDYRLAAPHGLDRPVLIDATVPQHDACRFVACEPLDAARMRVEDVQLAETPEVDADAGARINGYVARRGWQAEAIERESESAVPLLLGGDFDAFWRVGGARVAKLGLRGGFVHPLTGHSVPDSVRNALLIAGQKALAGPALHDLFAEEAARLWKKREPYRELAARLFGGGAAGCRQGLERLYGLDPATLTRIHGMRTGMIDRLRIQAALKG